jgi:hypothetical protein
MGTEFSLTKVRNDVGEGLRGKPWLENALISFCQVRFANEIHNTTRVSPKYLC